MARYISDKHLKAYQKGGVLNKLFETIKEDPELSFEIRQNNEAMVYYRKDKILTIKLDDKGKLTITKLSDGYYKGGEKTLSQYFDEEHIKHNLICKTEMRAYFKEAKKLVYVLKPGAEFNIQQNIALGNHSLTDRNRYLVVDMEWQYSQSGIQKPHLPKTRIDLIIVDLEKNHDGYNDIYLAELKLGLGATKGDSGTIGHVNKTSEIINSQRACDSLFEDVDSIIKQKIELGLIEGTKMDFHFGAKPKMMLILAYRGENELKQLELEYEKAKEEALRIGMGEPKCIMYNAFPELK